MKYLLLFAVLSAAALGNANEVSLWKGEDNALDSIGPNNGTWTGTEQYTNGIVGQAFLFNGSSDVSVANPVAGGLESASGFTIAAWMEFNSFTGGDSVANLRTSANDSGFTLEQYFGNTDSMVLYVDVAGLGFQTVSASNFLPNTWYMVAASFDAASGTMKIYQNGNLMNTTTGLGTGGMVTNAASQFEIGGNIANGDDWNGALDEVQFYNSALTDAQVRALDTPEPVTSCLLIAGVAGLVRRARRRYQAAH